MPGTRTLWTYSNCAGHHRGDVDARHRRAEDRPLAGGACAWPFGLSAMSNLRPPTQLAVASPSSRDPLLATDHAVLHARADRRATPSRVRRELQQRLARGRASEREVAWLKLVGCDWRRTSCPDPASSAVSHWISVHAIERHAELFGNQLRLRGVQSLTELALAGVGGDVAVRARWRSTNRAADRCPAPSSPWALTRLDRVRSGCRPLKLDDQGARSP